MLVSLAIRTSSGPIATSHLSYPGGSPASHDVRREELRVVLPVVGVEEEVDSSADCWCNVAWICARSSSTSAISRTNGAYSLMWYVGNSADDGRCRTRGRTSLRSREAWCDLYRSKNPESRTLVSRSGRRR